MTRPRPAARGPRIIRICEQQGVPVLADRAYQGAGPQVTTGVMRCDLRLSDTDGKRSRGTKSTSKVDGGSRR